MFMYVCVLLPCHAVIYEGYQMNLTLDLVLLLGIDSIGIKFKPQNIFFGISWEVCVLFKGNTEQVTLSL